MVTPEVAAEVVALVCGFGVLGLDALHHHREAVVRLRLRDEVNVIGHEAVRDDAHFALGGVAVEERQIEVAVRFGEEDVLTVIAALRDVLRQPSGGESRKVRHRYGSESKGVNFSGKPSSGIVTPVSAAVSAPCFPCLS